MEQDIKLAEDKYNHWLNQPVSKLRNEMLKHWKSVLVTANLDKLVRMR